MININDNLIITESNNRRLIEHGFTEDTILNVYAKVNGIICFSLRGSVIAIRESNIDFKFNKI